MQDRWEIQSQDSGKLELMLHIAGRTFDTLMHTPVTAFGLNFHFVRRTQLQDVGKRLAEMVNGLPLGRKPLPSDSGGISTTTPLPGRVVQELVTGIPGALGCVQVKYNVQHSFQPQNKASLIELTPLLRSAFQEDYPDCLARAEQIAKALTGEKKE